MTTASHELQVRAPILPPELEQLIFDIASSQLTLHDRLPLLLVAKRVHEWLVTQSFFKYLTLANAPIDRIKPTFYRVFNRLALDFIEENALDYPPSPTSLEDVGHFVLHFMIGGRRRVTEDQLVRILTLCPNATDVALWSGDVQTRPSVKSCLLRLPLQKLSANLSGLQRADFLTPSFLSITHLGIITMGSKRKEWKDWEILTSLPKLTHVCINKNVEVDAVHNLLSQCTGLRLLVAVTFPGSHRPSNPSESYHTIDDHRLILVDIYDVKYMAADWENGANGRFDLWDFGGLIRDARNGTRLFTYMNQWILMGLIGAYLKDNSQRWISRVFYWESELNDEGMEWYKTLLINGKGDTAFTNQMLSSRT